MDPLTFIAAMVAALAWPAAVVILGLSQRKPISRLIGRIKNAKLFGAELDIGDEIEAIREKIEGQTPAASKPDVPRLPAPSEPQDRQLRHAADELSKTSATGTIILAWLQLEEGLRQISELNKINWVQGNLARNLNALQGIGLLPPATLEAIHSLRKLRNQVAHSPEAAVSLQEASAYRETVDEILRTFGLEAGLHAWR